MYGQVLRAFGVPMLGDEQGPKAAAGSPMKVCFLFKPQANPDEALAGALAGELRDRGHVVFLDRRQTSGLTWVKNVEAQIRA